MSSLIRSYFTYANTAQGFVDYFASNLWGLEKIFILKGGPGTGKSYIIDGIKEKCEEKGLDFECIHCPLNPDSLDGIIIPGLKFAVVDGTAPHILEPMAPGVIEEYVNLGTAWDSELLKSHKYDILDMNEQMEECFHNTYKCFAEGLMIHDEWEKIYIKNMDFKKADKLTSETIKMVLGEEEAEKEAAEKHRFFGASTPTGSFDYIENLTDQLKKRYFIKGRPGTGKSTLLKKLAWESLKRGFDTEIYHCAFDSNSLDAVIIPELDVCVFDSTAPHLYEPSKPTDEIVDMYARCVKPGTDEKYERQIQGISARYKMAVQNGTEYLKTAKKLHDELKKYYREATDFSKVDTMRDDIIKELEAAVI